MDDPFQTNEAAPASPGSEDFMEIAREYLGGLRRRWKLVLLVTLLCLGAGAVHFAITPPTYEAKTTLQIERRTSNALLTNQLPWLDQYFNMEFYPTQYRLLQSRGLAEQVVQDLRLQEDSGFAAPATGDGGDASAGGDRAALGKLANKLLQNLSVQPIRDTQLVEITYRTDEPQEAARIANGFARAFIDFSLRTRSETMTQTSDVLAEQIQRLKDEVVDLDKRLGAFNGKEQTLSFTPEGNVSLERISKLNDELMTAMRDRIDKQARYQELAAMPSDAAASAGTGTDTAIADARKELANLQRDYQAQLQVYKENFPEMKDRAARIEAARQHVAELEAEAARRVRQAAYAEYQGALREEQALQGEIRDLKGQMSAENSQAVEYSSLQVELRTRRDMLNDLLKRQSETSFASRLQTEKNSNVRVIDEALVPGSPTQPSLQRDVSAGLAAGLLLGIGAALLLQFMDRTLKSAEEVERVLRLPVLAVIPDLADGGRGSGYSYEYGYGEETGPAAKGRRGWRDRRGGEAQQLSIELLPHAKPRLAVSEAYRSLRTALLLSTAHELKAVAVTSVEASEGKTATATNLAIVLAQLGRRVLLVDGDLRKPRLHKVFNVTNRTGLVTYLTTGSDEGIFHRTDVGGLFVVTSGPIPPNPSELLASDRMRELLAKARASFDYVVVDTPPALAVADSTIIGSMSDGLVLCVRSARVDRRHALRVLDRLRLAEIRVLGAVLNAHRATGAGGSYRYYYESYAEPGAETKTGSAA